MDCFSPLNNVTLFKLIINYLKLKSTLSEEKNPTFDILKDFKYNPEPSAFVFRKVFDVTLASA